jgi:hypothetical protein
LEHRSYYVACHSRGELDHTSLLCDGGSIRAIEFLKGNGVISLPFAGAVRIMEK